MQLFIGRNEQRGAFSVLTVYTLSALSHAALVGTVDCITLDSLVSAKWRII